MADRPEKKPHDDPILRKIDRIRRAVAFWTLGRGYLWVVLIVAVFVFGGVLADHAFVLQKSGRLAFFDAFVISLAAAMATATLLPALRRVSRIYVARRIEEQRPELRNALISYLQCRDDPSTPAEIKRLMARRAAGHIRSFGAGVAVDYTGYLRLAAAIAAVGAAFLLYWGFSPKSSMLSLERLFHPRADIRPPTATQLYDVKPGDIYVVKGDQPPLTASVRGVRPDGVWALWDGASFAGRRILLEHKDGDQWQGAFPPILEDGGYYLAAGDTRTDRYSIHVLPKLTVDRVRLELTPPAYTGLPSRTVENADAEAPAGTRVQVRAYTSVPPAQGYMEFDDGRRTWLDPVQGEQALGGELTLLQSGSYRVHFESVAYPDGSKFTDSAPVTYRLTCLADKPPTVSLVAPDDGVRMQPKDTAEIVYKAADDYGISHVRLFYTTMGVAMQTVEVAAPGVRELKEARYAWDLASTSAVAGQTLTYYVEVEDNRPGRAQTGQSEARRILITGPEGSPESSKRPPPAGAEQPKAENGQAAKEAGNQAAQQPPAGAQQPEQSKQPPADNGAKQPGQSPDQQGPGQGVENNPFQGYADHVRDIYNAMGLQPPGASEVSGATQAPGAPQAPSGSQGPGATQPPGGPQVPGQGSAASQQGHAGQTPNPANQSQQAPGAGQQAPGQSSAPGASQAPGAPQLPGAPQVPGTPQAQGADQPAGRSGAQGTGGQEVQSASGQQGPAGQSAGQAAGSPSGAGTAEGQGARGAQGQGGDQSGADQSSGAAGSQSGSAAEGSQGSSSATSPPGQGGHEGGAGASAAGAQGGAAAGGSQPGSGQSGAASQAQGAQAPAAGQPSGASAAGGASAPSGASAAGGGSATGAVSPTSGAAASGPPSGAAGGGGAGTGVKSLPLVAEPAPHTVPPLKDLDAAVENLSQMLDEDRVPERVFKDLGMNREQLRQFIEDYRRKRAEMPQQPEEPPAPLGEEPGRLIQGAPVASPGVQVKDTRQAPTTSDTLHSRFEGAADHLSSRYRDLVNQYYKALSEEQ